MTRRDGRRTPRGEFILTRVNANAIPVLERPSKDSQLRWSFWDEEWELGLRAANHDDEMAERERKHHERFGPEYWERRRLETVAGYERSR